MKAVSTPLLLHQKLFGLAMGAVAVGLMALPVFVTPRPSQIETPMSQAVKVLRRHHGWDLNALSNVAAKPVREAACQLDPNYPKPNVFGMITRYVWEYRRDEGPLAYLLLYSSRFTPSPFGSTIRLVLVDGKGATLEATDKFGIGPSRILKSARLVSLGETQYSAVEMEWGEGRARTSGIDYFAFIDGRFDLIRDENSTAEASRIDYKNGSIRTGIVPPQKTAEEWIGELESTEPVRVLRALVWLSGRHRPSRLEPSFNGENLKHEGQYELVRQIRNDPRTIALLWRLAGSEDKWLREAARLAQWEEEDRR